MLRVIGPLCVLILQIDPCFSYYMYDAEALNLTYVTDYPNHVIRRVSLTDGSVTTIAGNGRPGSVDGVGTLAQFTNPSRSTIHSILFLLHQKHEYLWVLEV
jgi:hypothetical protein